MKLKAAWDEARRHWMESPACKELIAILSNTFDISRAPNKVVCFSLGSLEGLPDHASLDIISAHDGLPHRGRMTQHAAALTMANCTGREARC